jgi:hypothetical protein
LVVDLHTDQVLGTGSRDRVTLGPQLAELAATILEAEAIEREAALPKPAHPRAA